MSTEKCPKCGAPLECLGGRSAHASNWYCSDELGCGWQAWTNNQLVKDDPIAELERKLEFAEAVIAGDNVLLSENERLKRKLAEQQHLLTLHAIYSGNGQVKSYLSETGGGEELNALLAKAKEEGRKEAVPEVTEAMALAFHRALSDGCIGQSEVEEIMTGLQAALLTSAPNP